MKTLARHAFAVSLLAGAMACGPDAVTMPVQLPGLEIPPPPPHVVVPTPPEPEPPASGPAPPATPPAPAIATRQTATRTDPSTPPRSTPDEPPPVGAPPILQTTATMTQAEQKVRTDMASATRDLARVDYKNLSADAKQQYNIVQGFLRQADLALKAKNIASAGSLAEKAKTMAALLVK